jgi:glycolate oxidase FAD binding subunit
VVKNVTGYDLPKVIAGSWGRLAAMTELTLKVLPRPAARATLIAEGLSPRQAWQAMAHCLQSHAEVAAAAHLPAVAVGARSITALRVQGFAPSVEARCQIIEAITHDDWRFARIDETSAVTLWEMLRTLSPLAGERPLWRVSLPARHAPDFLDTLQAADGDWLMDWAGGLVWYAGSSDAAAVRIAAATLGGHAMLMRGPEALRAAVSAFHPLDAGVAALEERVRRAFDPAGIFETGRF